MCARIKTVAFDLGGVLSYRDLSVLDKDELFLLDVYMKRNSGNFSKELVMFAESKILSIYLKVNKLYPYTLDLLYLLKSEKKRPSIWTNNIKELDSWLEEVGLYRFFDRKDVVNSFYLGVDKPDKAFYLAALRRLRNEPKDVFFVDDSFLNVKSAGACGINSLLFNGNNDSLEEVVREVKKR